VGSWKRNPQHNCRTFKHKLIICGDITQVSWESSPASRETVFDDSDLCSVPFSIGARNAKIYFFCSTYFVHGAKKRGNTNNFFSVNIIYIYILDFSVRSIREPFAALYLNLRPLVCVCVHGRHGVHFYFHSIDCFGVFIHIILKMK